jgi:DUF1680 family protein
MKCSTLLVALGGTLLLVSSAAAAEKAAVKVADTLVPLAPGAVRIQGHLGDEMDLCLHNRIMAQDVDHVIQPFHDRKDKGEWRSEFWGKWITSAIAAYRYSADPKLKEIIDRAVKGLIATQTPDGYIGAYPDGGHRKSWDIWGRKYTLLGLLAWYDITGDETILQAARRHADFLLSEVGPGKASPFENDMWSGMASSSVLEPMVLLFRRTNQPEYLAFGQFIVDQWATPKGPDLLRKALAGTPVFQMFPGPKPVIKDYGDQGKSKSYEMMSCYEGLAELYRVTGKSEYFEAAQKVFQNIRDTEITIIGSGSDWERWCDGRNRQTVRWSKGMETCVTVTWIKFAAQMLRLTGRPSYADEIEQATYNALLGAQGTDGTWWCHHAPLAGVRERAPEQCKMKQNCCVANGPRGLMLLPQLAVMSDAEGPVVNLYGQLSATAVLPSGNRVSIQQVGDYPVSDTVQIRVTPEKPEAFALKLRIPAWSTQTTLTLNNQAQPVTPGSYVSLKRTWNPGDTLTLKLDLRARLVRAPGDPSYVAVVRGPMVLARDRRLESGDIDAPAAIKADSNGFVDLVPVTDKPEHIWQLFRVPLADGKTSLPMCDFASAGKTWSEASQYRVWIPQPR